MSLNKIMRIFLILILRRTRKRKGIARKKSLGLTGVFVKREIHGKSMKKTC